MNSMYRKVSKYTKIFLHLLRILSNFLFDAVSTNDQLINRSYLLNLSCVLELSAQTFDYLYTAHDMNFLN
jgi:hypothetical protein